MTDANEARIVQLIEAALTGPIEPPDDVSAEVARMVRAVRINTVIRERVIEERDRLREEVSRLQDLGRKDLDENTALDEDNCALITERNALLAELTAARPIVEAAKEWRGCFDDEREICNHIGLGDAEVELADAIDAALAQEPQPTDDTSPPVTFTTGPYAACTCTPTAHGHRTDCPRYRP